MGFEAPKHFSTVEEYQSELQNQFNIIFKGDVGKDQLEWTWDALWHLHETNFPKFISGNIYTATPFDTNGGNISMLENDPHPGESGEIQLVMWPTKDRFIEMFCHETGHAIQKRQVDSVSGFSDIDAAKKHDGPISWYGANAESIFTDGSVSNTNENYAESVRLFLGQYLFPN